MNQEHEEEDYFKDARKLSRQERKRAAAKDRSKYKKTDIKKWEKKVERTVKEDLLRGRVLSMTPQGALVEYDDTQLTCVLRGVLKKEKRRVKNLVVVGDFVLFEKTAPDEGVIVHVEPRHSILSRADALSREREHILAANIDQVLITVSVVNPPLKPFLVDRYIIAARKGGMEPVIIVNKIDLLKGKEAADEKALYKDFLDAYAAANIPVISLSALKGKGLPALKKAMKGKASVFSGQSGVGKSSLINAITPFELKVGDVVAKTRKGAHTTTTAHLLRLDFGGWCIDTPGIKSFGVWELEPDEIEHYFSEIHAQGAACKFPNCSHSHEHNCAVIAAVEEGTISPLRYDSYQALMHSVRQKHRRR